MALLFMEGFEMFATEDYSVISEDTRCTYAAAGNIYNKITANGRFGGQCLWVGASGSSRVTYAFPNTSSTYYIGFAMRNTAYTSKEEIFYIRDDSNVQNILYCESGGALSVGRSTTVLATSTNTLSANTWHYVVLKIKLDNSVGTVELWIDGIKGIDETGLDTMDASNAYVNSIDIYHGVGYMDVDDLYIGDDSGTDMTDQVGDCHIEYLRPDANGNTNNFTPITSAASNYQEVDETVTDDDTTYVYSSTATHKDLYTTGNLTGDIDTVYAVMPVYRAKKMSAGDRTVNATIRSNVTETDATAHGILTDYTWHAEGIFENDPDGGGAWDETSVNAMEIGFEITS